MKLLLSKLMLLNNLLNILNAYCGFCNIFRFLTRLDSLIISNKFTYYLFFQNRWSFPLRWVDWVSTPIFSGACFVAEIILQRNSKFYPIDRCEFWMSEQRNVTENALYGISQLGGKLTLLAWPFLYVWLSQWITLFANDIAYNTNSRWICGKVAQ